MDGRRYRTVNILPSLHLTTLQEHLLSPCSQIWMKSTVFERQQGQTELALKTTCVSHTRRSAAHRRAIQLRWQHGCGLARHIGARIAHHRDRAHRSNAWRQGGVAASQPCLSTPLATPPPSSSTITAAIATTRKWRDHHHYHHHRHRDRAHHSGTVADVLTSPCFCQGVALRCIPWTTCEVRGSVAKAAVSPQCSGLALSSVNTYNCLFYHMDTYSRRVHTALAGTIDS